MTIYWTYAVPIRPKDINSSFEITEFQYNPGLHFEKIGSLHYTKETWRLVIKLDLTALNQRYEQLDNYLRIIETMCEAMGFQSKYHRQICDNLDRIAKKEATYLKNIMNQIRTIYRPPINKRRGLVDGIDSLVKSLFGTMHANDEKHINEQLKLLSNKQQVYCNMPCKTK